MSLSFLETRNGKVAINAVMRVKNSSHDEDLFEDIISSDSNLISIDFLNGRTLTESGFSKVKSSADKYYLEFFDNVDYQNIMDYLENDHSDFRVINEDGVVIRPCFEDLEHFGYKVNGERNNSDLASKPY